MARTLSNMLPLGTVAPHFELMDVVSGSKVKFRETPRYVATVIMFICNHCPFVKHINTELTQLANDYIPKGIRFLAINSNDVASYPDDSPENMMITAETHQYPFPYLFDETQEVAKAYNAACTPDFFVFDSDLSLVYRGQLDDSRPGNGIPVTGSSIRQALDYLLNNRPLDFEQKPSIGCNIKWKI
ncbi:thioredoxin family protein [Legionella sp. PATHC032]|uniref:thioredoxin family protein n=1 Tax=Legionella sp. PATHC032 TaxID=2992039 RepID=UPI001B1C90A4|nr:thioredoxin family protein [Legionella sp. PATHC032]MCW8421472.1 thioredoxin family protein [Legionella sp. PATHC032]HAZ7572591.1 thioredoxin family protein [Legionella pneumophila]HBA1633945.1 thioredoxin family protein [Legionella pneumophila]